MKALSEANRPGVSTPTGPKERRFLDALRDLFVGAKVDGQSGYINLMRIKAGYFQHAVEPALMKDIADALTAFPDFREELFDKLNAFFSRYFSKSGSICFAYTPQHMSIYDRVYTDEQDVVLFWKTHMLYYVKTDRLFRDLNVEIDGHKFFFDCTALSHKKANEKRELVYTFERVEKDGTIRLGVTHSERGRITKTEELLKALKKAEHPVKEAVLEKATKVFARQSDVDFFINKDARGFLTEQLDLWMYQYVFKDETRWTEQRIRQLQTIKSMALKLIAFIAQFEDELVRVWNKPKFIRGSHYVITLDRFARRPGGLNLLADFLKHAGMKVQAAEWQELGIVEEGFDMKEIFEGRGKDRKLSAAWRSLPLDTRHFERKLELRLLGLFDNLDEALDGRVIRSENYQALLTIKEKLKHAFKCCYIDPPYNSDGEEILYLNEYRNSSWLTLIENRLEFVRDLLVKGEAALIVAIDDFEAPHLIRLLRERFADFDVNPIVVNHHPQGTPKANISRTHEYAILVTPRQCDFVRVPRPLERGDERRFMRSGTGKNNFRSGRPNSFYAFLIDESTCEIKGLEEPPIGHNYPRGRSPEGWLRMYPINSREEERVWRKFYPSGKRLLEHGEVFARQGRDGITIFERVSIERVKPVSNWTDSKYNSGPHGTDLTAKLFGASKEFTYPKSIYSVSDIVDAVVYDDDEALILDFFAGSGTTGHAILNQNRELGCHRRYVLVEMAEYCDTVIIPRLKKVSFTDTWSNGKAVGRNGVSNFFKYFAVEQYEEAISNSVYEETGDLFRNTKTDPFSQYVFFRDGKMAQALELDYEKDEVTVHLDRLYPDIDLAETLSCVTGKWIKRVTAEEVEFADGTKESLTKPDWRLLKPLIFWGPIV